MILKLSGLAVQNLKVLYGGSKKNMEKFKTFAIRRGEGVSPVIKLFSNVFNHPESFLDSQNMFLHLV